MKKRERKKKDK